MGAHSKHSHLTQAQQSEQSSQTYAKTSRYAQAQNAQNLSRNAGTEHYTARRKTSRRKNRILRGVLITLAVLVVGMGVAAAAYIANINGKITSGIDESLRSVLTETKASEPFYMLLLGIDKDESRTNDKNYGSSDSAYRTDTIILARIDPQNKKVTLISIPRDLYVDMGKYGKGKINSAYSYGGPSFTTQVVSQLAGVPISHYAQIDMDGFAAIVDAIGGVDVNLPVAVYDPKYTGLNLPAGEQHLDGITAALLGRTRHAYDNYGDGDTYRAANQRMLIGAVVRKVMASDPITIANTISSLAGYVTTDMDVASIVALAGQFGGIDVDNDIYSGACPTTSKYMDNLWYELLNADEWKELMRRVNAGEAPYTSSSQDRSAGIAGSVGQSVDASSTSSSGSSSSSSVTPVFSGNVTVLNGTTTSGLASKVSNVLTSAGFTCSASNASQTTSATKIYYNGDGAAKAAGVAQTLGVSAAPEKNDGTYNSIVDVIVVVGNDYQG